MWKVAWIGLLYGLYRSSHQAMLLYAVLNAYASSISAVCLMVYYVVDPQFLLLT